VLAAFLTGCGERREPLADVPLPRATAVQAADPAMARLVDALGLRQARKQGGPGTVVLAWASDGETAADARRGNGYVGADDTVAQVESSIADIALRLGVPLRGRELVAAIERDRQDARGRVRGLRPTTVFVDLGFFATAGERTLVGDLIRQAGGTNVAGATPEPGPFDLRALRAADPDLYVISSESRTTAQFLRQNPRTRTLRAVRAGRVVLVPAAALAPGPRVGDGLVALARALHPEAYR
jgi:iron complex transport system substrate-binding protein